LASTIHDVAKQAGVGIGTVSSVLNNSRPVKENTRQKVLSAIAELDFMPNSSGRRLSMGKTHTIGVVIPYFTIASQIERLRGAMSVIVDSDYDISLFTVENVPQRDKVLQTVPRRGRVDGLLIFSLDLTDDNLYQLQQEKIPTVLIETTHPQLSHLYFNDVAAARKAVEYLIDLGHRKIFYINEDLNDPFGSVNRHNRYLGYCQALQAKNLQVYPAYYREGWHRREKGRLVALDILKLPDRPTAIFTFSDELALGVLQAAQELGINVPHELSVMGYDDIELAQFAHLTTVQQHLFETGVQGVEMLFNVIHKKPDLPLQQELPTDLIIRQTTAPLGNYKH